MGSKGQIGYPSDVTDEEWAFVAPFLALCREDSEQREYSLHAVFNGLRYIVRTGGQWRYMPNDLPPSPVVYQRPSARFVPDFFRTGLNRRSTFNQGWDIPLTMGRFKT
jgi:transposase